ncbi:diphthine synthase [Archaeoglobales archaeon]|nr:MAG: diphthine synthase [Archaeoglobales archaeon]
MLTFVGLGLWDEKDVSIKGYEAVKRADEVYVEFYTSKLLGTDIDKISKFFGRKVWVLERKDLEEESFRLIDKALNKNIVILIPGDPMIATTHSALRLEAEKKGVKTAIIHGASIVSAVCGLTGLHNYRFGRSATISYPYKGKVSKAPMDIIKKNRSIDAHTLLYLDLHPKPMSINEALEILLKIEDVEDKYAVGIARAGSNNPFVKCDRIGELLKVDFGEPLHVLVVLAKSLHFMEFECLKKFADAPDDLKKFIV